MGRPLDTVRKHETLFYRRPSKEPAGCKTFIPVITRIIQRGGASNRKAADQTGVFVKYLSAGNVLSSALALLYIWSKRLGKTLQQLQMLNMFKVFFSSSSLSSCSKELNQWEPLTEYGQSKGHSNPYLVLECAWRVSNWAAMKEALVQVRSAQAPCVNKCMHGFLCTFTLACADASNRLTENRIGIPTWCCDPQQPHRGGKREPAVKLRKCSSAVWSVNLLAS